MLFTRLQPWQPDSWLRFFRHVAQADFQRDHHWVITVSLRHHFIGGDLEGDTMYHVAEGD